MTLSGDLWKANHGLVQPCLYHPFVQELADRYASDTRLVRSTYRYAMECERDFFQAAFDSVNPIAS